MVSVRAIYHNGQLQPLEPLNLEEGQQVQLHILEPETPLTALITDMLVHSESEPEKIDFDEETMVRELNRQLAGKRPLSEIILEDR